MHPAHAPDHARRARRRRPSDPSFTPVARAALLFASGFLMIVIPIDIIQRHGMFARMQHRLNSCAVAPGPAAAVVQPPTRLVTASERP